LQFEEGAKGEQGGSSQDVSFQNRFGMKNKTEIPNSFRLLLIKVLHGGEIFKNEEEVTHALG
jgi:hypothetical protein